PKIDNNWR
ncbi:hypothetical protein D043_5075B, partial [Vibrio parahaemolyticus EKP-021]